MIEITGPRIDGTEHILTPEAIAFVDHLHQTFAARRQELLAERRARRADAGNGRDPRFLSSTAAIREDDGWRVAGAGPGLEDRRVEITGPTDPKMAINALNSGARVWLADLEDATSPTWANIAGGQRTLYDAVRGRLAFTSPEGKEYRVTTPFEHTPTIVMRPRGWQLVEKHLAFTDRAGRTAPASASLTDFGLYFWHNAQALVDAGRGPYFYLPKLESHLEARLWNDIFVFAQQRIGMPVGTIRATVLIETIPAAFEMDEILYELRDHCAGLNAGRWDYIFSMIKTFQGRGRRFAFGDRDRITMTVPFMRAYTELLVATCHRRGAHAIGGMSAFIPNRRDPEATARALARVAEDKRREAADGFDGTWVAHPDLIPTALAEFDAVLGDRPNQVSRRRDDVTVTADDLLDVAGADATVTDAGVRSNVSVALRYIEAWLRGTGAVAIDGLMEDAATAEISRSLLRQWIDNRVVTAEGNPVDRAAVEWLIAQELTRLESGGGEGRFADAAELLAEVVLGEDFPTFLTIPAYARYLVESGDEASDDASDARDERDEERGLALAG
ncbi:malate synthase A [Leifsonia xyli]|uniref:malate synthase A n=1 Tax=Leifsonia xyli TaxID=1575 RepID=UPI003D67F572